MKITLDQETVALSIVLFTALLSAVRVFRKRFALIFAGLALKKGHVKLAMYLKNQVAISSGCHDCK